MVKFIRLHWFGLCLGLLVLCFMLFTAIIAVAPHNDARMRGFTPCTYQMAVALQQNRTTPKSHIFKIIGEGYWCYFRVIGEGIDRFVKNEQPTPWAN